MTNRYTYKPNLSTMDKKGKAVVKCGMEIQKGCYVAANQHGEAVLSRNRFDVVGVALEDGEKDDMIKIQLY